LKTLIYVSIITLFVSCGVLNTGKSSANSFEKPIYNAIFAFADSNNVMYFTCDTFVLEALDRYVVEMFNKRTYRFLKQSKQPKVNIHDPAIIDTIYTFSDSRNTIQFYRAVHNDFIFAFDVVNSKFKLNGDIKTGMSKADFIKKFNIVQPIVNEVQIENIDGTLKFNFKFEKNKLKRINAYLYID
jgi:hypothetical protein